LKSWYNHFELLIQITSKRTDKTPSEKCHVKLPPVPKFIANRFQSTPKNIHNKSLALKPGKITATITAKMMPASSINNHELDFKNLEDLSVILLHLDYLVFE